MSTISGVSSASSAWPEASTGRAHGGGRKERMFAKADTNGDGSVDSAELQSMLDKMAQGSGTTAPSADTLMQSMDTDGSGGLSADELDAGMKSLRAEASSTVDFAQQRAADGASPPDGPPPPPDSTNATRPTGGLDQMLSDLFTAADSNGDGALSNGELDTLKTNFDTAIQSLESGSSSTGSTGSTGDTSSTDGSTSGSGTNADSTLTTLAALTQLMLREYASTAASSAASTSDTSTSISVTA